MIAILLAAGLGSRLGEKTKSAPKSLIPVGNTTVIEHLVSNLLKVGVDQIIIVTGFFNDKVEEKIRATFPNEEKIITTHNPDYLQGSGSSLKCAMKNVTGEVLIIEADLLCHHKIFEPFLEPSVKNAIAIGQYSNNRLEGRVRVKNGYISDISIDKEPNDNDPTITGDWVGIAKFSKEATRTIQTFLNEANITNIKDNFQYSKYIFKTVKAHKFKAIDLESYPGIEIDNEDDLNQANLEVWPKRAS